MTQDEWPMYVQRGMVNQAWSSRGTEPALLR